MKNIIGKKYNKLTVIKFVGRKIIESNKGNQYKYYYLFKCDCGKLKEAEIKNIKYGSTKSCGCAKILPTARTHGLFIKDPRNARILNAKWGGMKMRCINSNHANYKHYGGRGIKVCNRWMKFENFYNDMIKSFKEHNKKNGIKNTTLDRKDFNGNYEPSNCRWATWEIQHNNKRISVRAVEVRRLSKITGLSRTVINGRLSIGWTYEEVANNFKMLSIRKSNYKDFVNEYKYNFKNLPNREQYILIYRYGIKDKVLRSLEETGKHFGLSRERIRQLEKKSFELLVK